MKGYPYAERFGVLRAIPAQGRDREAVLAELRAMAREEDAFWETGKASGTMYAGDHAHYNFLNEAYGMFAHMNTLQRDMCPSATRFEGEILAMTLDLMHGNAVTDSVPGGLMSFGGTGSIMHALLAYRDRSARRDGITAPNFVKPTTGHAAFDKACHLLGIECRIAPLDPATMQADVAATEALVDKNTIAIMGSAGDYAYGVVDPIAELSDVALRHGIGLHVDACLGGFILPFGEELGHDIPPFDFRIPGVTSISADTHKYGYGFKGTSTVVFRDKELRNEIFFFLPGWPGGKYMSPGIEGSRSGGLLAATWAAMVQLGRDGFLTYAKEIFDTSTRMQEAVRSHQELRLLGRPTFLFSFTSDVFDVYHVFDFMSQRGWRFNGQQYPNAIHMAVTRPQTMPGVADAFAADLAESIGYATEREAAGARPLTGAMYGGVTGGFTQRADDQIRVILTDILDSQLSVLDAPCGESTP